MANWVGNYSSCKFAFVACAPPYPAFENVWNIAIS